MINRLAHRTVNLSRRISTLSATMASGGLICVQEVVCSVFVARDRRHPILQATRQDEQLHDLLGLMESYGRAFYWERDAGSDPGSDGVDRRQDWAGREGFIFLVSSIAAKGQKRPFRSELSA